MSQFRSICIMGLGYIGLPTAAVLAHNGFHIHGVEPKADARDIINSGRAHVIEPDLDQLVKSGVDSGRLRAHASPTAADIFMICVPTPVGSEREPDLSYVDAATTAIAPFLRPGNLVILESTSPPGTTERIRDLLNTLKIDTRGLHFAHAPERVLPGRILYEVVNNNRIIGGLTPADAAITADFYRTFVKGEIITCHARMAEMVKVTENASRDVQIAFANELSMICEQLDLDPRELIDIANRHPRVNILQPGCGVGGHCIAVDPWFLVHMVPKHARLMRMAREVNLEKPRWVTAQVMKAANAKKYKTKPVIACLGAAYKPDIDDLRESPALEIIHDLQSHSGCKVVVVEPNVSKIDNCVLVDLDTALKSADILVFLVNHASFKTIPREALAKKDIIDTCGTLHQKQLGKAQSTT